MTTPPTEGAGAPTADAPAWSPRSGTEQWSDSAGASFDPYRFGAPEQPVPVEYAPYQNSQQQLYASQSPYPYQPQQSPWLAPNGQPYAQPRPGNGKAVTALVLGILSMVLCVLSFLDVFLIIPAIIFGSLALNDAKRNGGAGRGMAISGLVCAVIGAVLAMMLTVWLAPKVARCANDYPRNSAAYNTCIRDIVR